MRERDLVETRPDPRYRGMPVAMALIILHRALWPVPLVHGGDLLTVRVVHAGGPPMRLDEQGDWEPVIDGVAASPGSP